MTTRRWLGGLVTVAILVTVAWPGVATGASVARPVADPAAPIRTVTLVTGDRVVVALEQGGPSLVRVDAGPGRRVGFAATQFGGHLRVVPSDVLPMLHSGRLDPRLFDVTTLLGFGYDDRRADLPLIVTGAAVPTLAGASGRRAVPRGQALRIAKRDAAAAWRSLRTGPGKVWLDGLRKPSLDVSVPHIGAPAAWAAGFTGSGVTVGVVDTGVDAAHPDLAGRVVAARDFIDSGNTLDTIGHGTHVAATIASGDTTYRGVAPDARIVAAKVCGDFGCPESAILAGMQWAVDQGARVVNMSLGGFDSPDIDPLEAAVNDLTAQFGVLFVIAAGNDGADGSIHSPGSADAALTVAAFTKTDELAFFSSRGPRRNDHALKPDIAAPGVDIVAALSQDAGGAPGQTHIAFSGTSMATPHVAGAAALLAQQHPQWTPAQLKAALMGSTQTKEDLSGYAQGAGRVDLARAVTQTVLADPASVSFGLQQWPHTDDAPDSRQVTYANTTATPVTLNLSLTGDTPPGLFTLSASTLTVPAGGSASVTLTSDTRVNVPDTRYTGNIVATAGASRVTTPFGVDKEVESHNLTVRHLDRAGQPTATFFTALFDPVSGAFADIFTDGATVRVPAARFAVFSGIFGPDAVGTMLLEPEIVVDRDTTLTLDARHGRPIRVTTPLPDVALEFAVGAIESPEFGSLVGLMFGAPESALFTGSAHPNQRSPFVTSMIVRQDTRGDDLAQVMFREEGRAFPGFTKRVTPGDLAEIRVRHASEVPASGLVRLRPVWPDGWVSPVGPGTLVSLPGTRTEYYNVHDGISWTRELDVFDESLSESGNVLISLARRFEGGRKYEERRNLAVYGPGFAQLNSPEGWVIRRGDTLELLPTIVNDQLNWFAPPLTTDTFRLTVDRNGQRIFTGDQWSAVDVPPGDARYRLGVEIERHGYGELSTMVSTEWTFRSTTVPGDVARPLPLSAVRFLPPLDDRNTAPANRPWAIPIEVQKQPGSTAGAVRTLTVEASFDDGRTWHRVPTVHLGAKGVVLLTRPQGTGYVSLRAESTDNAGNTVRQTIVRAYKFG